MSGHNRQGSNGGSGHSRQGSNGGQRVQQAKLVLLGDQGVGKSSLSLRFVRGLFPEHSEATVGAAFLTQTLQCQGYTVKFDIWDTAGQERYKSLAPMYYRGAQAAIVVYDINNANTFKRAVSWVNELRQHTTTNIVIVLCGNKLDLADNHRVVETADARLFAEENGLIFAEASAKTGVAVNEMFMMIAQKVAGKPQGDDKKGLRVNPDSNDGKKGGCGC